MPTEQPSGSLAEVVEATRHEQPVPGVAVGVVDGDEELVAGFGVTNVDHPLSVDGDTLFQIGSITKTVTATAVMRLVERGTLLLDSPVRTYLPSLRLRDEDVASRVTLRHLLTHRGGWFGDFFADTGPGDDALARYVERLVDLEQLTALGAVWAYSNAGFALAARVLEVVHAMPAEAAIRELVLEPLAMTRSFFFAGDAITHRVAAGHFVYPDGPAVARPWYIPRNANAIGGIASSARDMLRFARFHLGDGTGPDGTRLLSAESMRRMQTAHAPGALDAGAGLAWRLSTEGGVEFASHGGGTIGQLALLTIAPSRRFALVVLTNSTRGGFVQQAVSRWAFARHLRIEDVRPAVRERSSAELGAYVGRYESPGAVHELRVEGASLAIRSESRVRLAKEFEREPPKPPPATVAFIGDDRILVLDGPTTDLQGEFLRDGRGAIEWLRIGGRIHRRVG